MNNELFFDYHPTMGEFLSLAHEQSLPEETILTAVKRACDFFQMPEVEVVEAMQTCEWSNNPYSYFDDRIGYNRDELKNMHIHGEDALTLIFTHEVTHRRLQSLHHLLDPWTEESACDYMMGVNAGLNHMDVSEVVQSLGSTHGWLTHPTGDLRAETINAGVEYAQRMLQRDAIPTFDQCMQEFNLHMKDKAPEFEQAKQQIFDEIAKAETARGANGVNSAEWNTKQAQSNQEWAEWHEKEAKAALDRGDTASAKDHYSRAGSYRQKAEDYKKAAQSSTKP